MKTFLALTKRNVKMFFKDKGMFISSLITPIILLVLYSTFLAKIYRDSFMSGIPENIAFSKTLINGMVGGELVSSLLAVSCVTVAFCSNLLMVNDKVSGARKDMLVSPCKRSIMALSYYCSSLIATLIVAYVALGASFIYIAVQGWYLSIVDVLLVILDVFLLSMFGVALSSIVNCFLKTSGQASAVGTVVSSGYGFICGAYMPISNFGSGLQKVLSLLPGTYGTSLIRNHMMQGSFAEMNKQGLAQGIEGNQMNEILKGVKRSIDCTFDFFSHPVTIVGMYSVIIGTIVLLITIYVLIQKFRKEQ